MCAVRCPVRGGVLCGQTDSLLCEEATAPDPLRLPDFRLVCPMCHCQRLVSGALDLVRPRPGSVIGLQREPTQGDKGTSHRLGHTYWPPATRPGPGRPDPHWVPCSALGTPLSGTPMDPSPPVAPCTLATRNAPTQGMGTGYHPRGSLRLCAPVWPRPLWPSRGSSKVAPAAVGTQGWVPRPEAAVSPGPLGGYVFGFWGPAPCPDSRCWVTFEARFGGGKS